jgi:hypothetical protein
MLPSEIGFMVLRRSSKKNTNSAYRYEINMISKPYPSRGFGRDADLGILFHRERIERYPGGSGCGRALETHPPQQKAGRR